MTIDSTEDLPTAQTITSDIENLINKGGFQVKGWIFSDDPMNQEKTAIPSEPNTSTEKVLGIIWNPVKDYLCFEVKLNFSCKKHKLRVETHLKTNPLSYEIPEELTKRIILSQVNSIYDPLGLSEKIMMRQIWASDIKMNWDDPFPEENKRDWIMFFKELHEMDNVKFKRCMKPCDAVGDPILIIFSDGSSQAFGARAYVRWELKGGLFKSSLIPSKNRLAPIKKFSIDRIELCGAIINKQVSSMYHTDPKPTFFNVKREPTAEDLMKAEDLWIKEAQRNMQEELKAGKYKRLCPHLRKDGIYVVGGRATRWMEMSYNKSEVILLPQEHRFSHLYAEYVHNRGVSTTASKIRSKFWITKLLKMTKSIKYNCIICRKLDKKLSEQVMGELPEERLKPSPAWHCTAIDLFGPFKIKDEVRKQTTGKAYGVIFNCLRTRAVYLDLTADYSTEKFLMVLRRFVSSGYPFKLYSDNGPQLVAANKELKRVTKGWDWEELTAFGNMESFQWEFTTADAPWQNGVSEALVKSVKRAIAAAIHESILTFSELQTVLFEIANLINERPIGRHPTSPDDGTYLCPNDLLLGRSTARVPSGPFKFTYNPQH